MTSKKQSIILGGLVAGLLSTSYLGLINIACCAGIIIGALVGVWHYTNENGLTIKAGEGAAIGALIGVLAVLISFCLDYLLHFVGIPGSQEINQQFQGQIQQMFGGGDMTPEQKEQVEAMQGKFDTPAFKAMGLAVGAAVSAIFGAIGGAIGAAVFKKGTDSEAEVL